MLYIGYASDGQKDRYVENESVVAWKLEIWNGKTFCSRKLNRRHAHGKDLGGPCDRLECGDDCVDSCNVISSSANETCIL